MQTAKLFKNGRSQAVRLPAEFRFEGDEVLIRRDPLTGDVILSQRNKKFEEWLKLRDKLIAKAPKEFEDFEIPRDPGPPVNVMARGSPMLDTNRCPTCRSGWCPYAKSARGARCAYLVITSELRFGVTRCRTPPGWKAVIVFCGHFQYALDVRQCPTLRATRSRRNQGIGLSADGSAHATHAWPKTAPSSVRPRLFPSARPARIRLVRRSQIVNSAHKRLRHRSDAECREMSADTPIRHSETTS